MLHLFIYYKQEVGGERITQRSFYLNEAGEYCLRKP